PRDALLLAGPELAHREVAALGLQAVVGEHLADLLAVGERREVGAVADRRAELQAGHPDLGPRLHELVEVLEHPAEGVALAADRQAQRARAELRGPAGQDPGRAEGRGPRHELSP